MTKFCFGVYSLKLISPWFL